MKKILLSDWLPEQARWRSGSPAFVPQEKNSPFWPSNKSFMDPLSFVLYPLSFIDFIDLNFVSVNKKLRQYPTSLDHKLGQYKTPG